jgi:zinc protease
LMRGTRTLKFNQIFEAIESIGARLSVSSSTHSTSFRGKALAEDLETILTLLSDVLRHPTFPSREVERLRAQLITSLAIEEQDTGARAHIAFEELLYPGHPYSQQTTGYIDTVQALGIDKVRRFHREHYHPQGMIISVVGAVEAAAVHDLVGRIFGDWTKRGKKPAPDLPHIDPPREIKRIEIPLDGKQQCDIVLGTLGPSRYDEDYLPAVLGNNILGRFGQYGRIGDSVRENAGLAYYSYSVVSGGPGPGPWQVIAGVAPQDVERAIALIREEIGRFTSKRVSPQELLENQANFVGRLPLQLESNEGVAGALVYMERYQLGLDYYQTYPEQIKAISREQILDTARRYLDQDRLVIAIAGPTGEIG